MADIIAETKARMQAALEHLKKELKALRAGRASPAFLESVTLEVYGTQMKLKDVANISTPEARQLLITPFDAQNAGPCAKAIEKANLGVTPVVEGKSVRVTFPEPTESRRKDLIAQAHKKREECKITVRNERRNQNEALKKLKLPEDDAKRQEKQIQELTDKCCKEADDLTAIKEKEIMTV